MCHIVLFYTHDFQTLVLFVCYASCKKIENVGYKLTSAIMYEVSSTHPERNCFFLKAREIGKLGRNNSLSWPQSGLCHLLYHFQRNKKKRKEAEEVDGDARDEISRFLESSFLTWNCKVAGMAIVKSFCYPWGGIRERPFFGVYQRNRPIHRQCMSASRLTLLHNRVSGRCTLF